MKKITLLAIIWALSMAAFAQDVIYVDIDASGDNDGSSWENAYTDLFTGLLSASSSDEVWVAEGVYLTSSPFAWLVDDLSVYGGFEGNESTKDDRDWIVHETIMSGDVGVDGDYSDNAQTVFYGPIEEDEPIETGLLDGFIIEKGNADDPINGPQNSGGGVYLGFYDGEMLFRNCTMRDNRSNNGAGVFISAQIASDLEVIFENCRFTENWSSHGAPFSLRTEGGEMYVAFYNCLFDNNEIFDNPDFSVGWSGHAGEIMALDGGNVDADFANCTWVSNRNTGTGSTNVMFPIYRRFAGGSGEVAFTNCIFNDNDLPENNFQVGWEDAENLASAVDVVITNSMFANVTDMRYTTGTNVWENDPLFEDLPGQDYTLSEGSPAIDSGSTSAVSGIIPMVDLAGNNRFQGEEVDLGCYESEPVEIDDAAILQNEFVNIQIYPNPSSGLVFIETTFGDFNLELIDLTGKRVLFSNEGVMDLSDFESGIYILKITHKDRSYQRQIIKK